jgi:DNA repair exonuclease SbcCD nuclease subunit
MKVLCTADVHIGRRPSRLPSHVDCRSLSCGEAWGRIVDLAVEEKVDLVAVAGDLVDRANRFYEAAGPVELGLRRLAHAGIATVMVAGNHDHDVLPWLLEGLGPDEARLLGRGGRWERFTLERRGEVLHVDGWSFPESSVQTSPLASYSFAADGAPVLGLLHADLDQPRSRYAPVSLAELRPRAPALWLLGHVHASRLVEEPGSASVLYPGSPQAMDPGEAGAHGVWIAEIGPARTASCRMVPLSSVRYEAVEVSVDGISEASEIDRRVVDAVRAGLRCAAEESAQLRYLSCRLRLVGRTSLHRALEERLRGVCDDLCLSHGEATAFVEEVEVRTAPERDLVALAGGKDAPAVLARLVAELTDAASGPDELLREATRRVDEVKRARPYLALVRDTDDEREGGEEEIDVAAELREQAALLLDELLAQKERDA